MKIKITFEFNTDIFDEMSSDRRRCLSLKIEKCMNELRTLGRFLDDYEGSLYPKSHYTEEVVNECMKN